MSLRQWIKSANFAIEGILHAAQTQRHLRYHFYAAAAVVFLGYILGVSKTEFLIIALAAIAVLVAEMLNTAVEAAVDLISPDHHEKAGKAKDIAAGAVLITAFGSALIGYVVLMPHIRDAFDRGVHIIKRPSDEIVVISFILVLITVVLLKAYTGKGHPLSGGMPSGHTAIAFSVWTSVTMTTRNWLVSLLCLALAILIGQSRISAGVHKPLEVFMGGLLGALITFLLFQVFG